MSRTLPQFFPPVESSRADGLLMLGGKLDPAWILDAYRHGIFPWPIFGERLAWWSPDPRAIFELKDFHVSRSLARTCRRGEFEVSFNRDFAGVIQGCATAQQRKRSTWITRPLRAAYRQLHELGHAHSVEVWHGGLLAGGTYGVAIGGLFAAESMFHYVTDASKVALVHLVNHLRQCGYHFMDIQQLTPHTASLGAVEIRRRDYLRRLEAACSDSVTFGSRHEYTRQQSNVSREE